MTKPSLAALALLGLIGCAPQVQRPPWQPPGSRLAPWQAPNARLPGATTDVARQRVGLLLPLSGSNAALGQSMLNAAQLALFEQADARVEFIPRDTRGSAAGAANAARAALSEGATVLVGPLTLGETAAAGEAARAAGVPMLSFTSDESQAGNGVWVLGITPTQVARRMAGAAVSGGARRIGLLAHDDEFGRRLATGLRAALGDASLPAPLVMLSRPGTDPAQNAREFANQAAAQGGIDAVLIGLAGLPARLAAQGLAAASMTPPPRLLGTHLWAGDGQLGQEPALVGAIFAGSDPSVRGGFDSRYQQAFGERPPRLAGTAYDAAALAARAARDGGRALPVGEAFLGADGPIRLMPEGRLARGMAILELRQGEPSLRESAPIPGAAGS